MVDCGNKPPRQTIEKSAEYRTEALLDWFRENNRPVPFLEDQEAICLTIENAVKDGVEDCQKEIEQLRVEYDNAKARAKKLETALKTIMLKWSDSKLCSRIAVEALHRKD